MGSRALAVPEATVETDDRGRLLPQNQRMWSKHTLSRWLTKDVSVLIICSIATIIANLGVGSMPLLIPIQVTVKDYRFTWTGILFLVYGLVVFFCEILQSKIVPFVGTKRAFVGSSCGLGLCYLSFGLLDLTTNEVVFGGLACSIRIIEGLCYSGLMNSILTILCLAIPEKAILGIGLIDGLIGVGYALGPLFSAYLFSVTGFTLPYALIAILLFITAATGKFGLPNVQGYMENNIGALKYMYKDLQFCGSIVIVFSMGIVVGFLEATLEKYLSRFDKGTVVEGSIFFIGWITGAASSPFWGWLLRKTGRSRLFLLAGPVIEAVVFIFFGPFPGLDKISMDIGLSITCLIIMTMTTSMSLLAGIDLMLKRAEVHGIDNDIKTYAFISAIWLASLYLGEGIGGIISGTILYRFSYDQVAITLITIELILVIVGGILLLIPWERCCTSGHSTTSTLMNGYSRTGRAGYERLE